MISLTRHKPEKGLCLVSRLCSSRCAHLKSSNIREIVSMDNTSRLQSRKQKRQWMRAVFRLDLYWSSMKSLMFGDIIGKINETVFFDTRKLSASIMQAS